MPTDPTALTRRFVLPPEMRQESDPRFGSWEDFVALMEAVEWLCGEWPPARSEPFVPASGPFLI